MEKLNGSIIVVISKDESFQSEAKSALAAENLLNKDAFGDGRENEIAREMYDQGAPVRGLIVHVTSPLQYKHPPVHEDCTTLLVLADALKRRIPIVLMVDSLTPFEFGRIDYGSNGMLIFVERSFNPIIQHRNWHAAIEELRAQGVHYESPTWEQNHPKT